MSLCASPRHTELHAFFTFDTRKWSASRPGLPPPKKKILRSPPQTGNSGRGGATEQVWIFRRKEKFVSLGNQNKFSRSASSPVTISTELSPLIKLFYLRIYINICGRNSEHYLCSCNIITRLRGVYSVVQCTKLETVFYEVYQGHLLRIYPVMALSTLYFLMGQYEYRKCLITFSGSLRHRTSAQSVQMLMRRKEKPCI